MGMFFYKSLLNTPWKTLKKKLKPLEFTSLSLEKFTKLPLEPMEFEYSIVVVTPDDDHKVCKKYIISTCRYKDDNINIKTKKNKTNDDDNNDNKKGN